MTSSSDYMISQLIEEDMLAELDYSRIPNYGLISDRFKGLTYDPQERYTVPYAWGTVGIIYNTSMVEEPSPAGPPYSTTAMPETC